MVTDILLLDRIEHILSSKGIRWTEKKMFGGDCFMVDEKMCFGTYKGGLMVRVEPDETSRLLKKTGATQMIHVGKPMTGYLFIEPIGYDNDRDLEFWIQKCLDYNPKARSSRKK